MLYKKISLIVLCSLSSLKAMESDKAELIKNEVSKFRVSGQYNINGDVYTLAEKTVHAEPKDQTKHARLLFERPTRLFCVRCTDQFPVVVMTCANKIIYSTKAKIIKAD